MMMKIEILQSIENVSHAEWQALTPSDFPFLKFHFLQALEATDCLGSRTGWEPLYLMARHQGELVGALVTYLKTNSYGEFIFDFAWAQAHESVGLDYYPKLISAIPFTPATGPKVLLSGKASDELQKSAATTLLQTFRELGTQLGTSSQHILFLTENEIPIFREAGFFIRHSYQYHWRNLGYSTFQDFLQSLRSKRRKETLREREIVAKSGVVIDRLAGSQLDLSAHADLAYDFYSSTTAKMGGYNYLTRSFFREIFSRMKDNVLFVLAKDRHGQDVAGALNMFSGSKLFGRYWGCLDDYKALHFEVCYYQGIEFAIAHHMSLFEAGAQGEHKFQRGFTPNWTYSAHRIQDPQLDHAIQDFVRHEKRQLERLFEEYEAHTPFSRAEKANV